MPGVIADKLDVDPTEIEIADVRKFPVTDYKSSAEIILTDELPNGSGLVRYLFENFDIIVSECITEQEVGTYLGDIHSESHRNICKDACYDCLKVFRNMNYHGLLDWRLGIAILRTYIKNSYVAGADGHFEEFIELKNWFEDACNLRNNFATSFNLDVIDEFKHLPVLATRNKSRYIIVVHPLWDCYADENGNLILPEDMWITEKVFEVVEIAGGMDKVRFVDTFNLQRRPGWCYKKLFS
jgi:DEAD/DEAH box helicase domain-containing protein